MFIIFERERERESRDGAERKGDTESEAGSRLQLSAQSGAQIHKPRDHDLSPSRMFN